jgi:hypothetical protein
MILKELRMSVGEMTKLTVNPLLIPEVSPPQTIHRSKSLRRGESAQSPAAVSKHSPEMSQSVFIENQAALDGASLDRVRVCFRAHVGSLEICPEDSFPCPVRYKVCLLLDSSAVEMLSSLAFSEDDVMGNSRRYKLRAVGIYWGRPEQTSSSYRGAKDLQIDSLRYNYDLMESLGLESAE